MVEQLGIRCCETRPKDGKHRSGVARHFCDVVLVGKKVNHSRVESIHRLLLIICCCPRSWTQRVAKCAVAERSTERQSLMSLAGLLTSDSWFPISSMEHRSSLFGYRLLQIASLKSLKTCHEKIYFSFPFEKGL
jgi:hypothetical protein